MIHHPIFMENDDKEWDLYIQYIVSIHPPKHYINYQLLSLSQYKIILFHNNSLHSLIPYSLILHLNYLLIHLNNQILSMYPKKQDFYLNLPEVII